jgi:hypothetical protein
MHRAVTPQSRQSVVALSLLRCVVPKRAWITRLKTPIPAAQIPPPKSM